MGKGGKECLVLERNGGLFGVPSGLLGRKHGKYGRQCFLEECQVVFWRANVRCFSAKCCFGEIVADLVGK